MTDSCGSIQELIIREKLQLVVVLSFNVYVLFVDQRLWQTLWYFRQTSLKCIESQQFKWQMVNVCVLCWKENENPFCWLILLSVFTLMHLEELYKITRTANPKSFLLLWSLLQLIHLA